MYTNQHTHTYAWTTIYIFWFPPCVLLLHLSLFLPSVCTQCQPVISPCKVSVVRSPCVWILLSSQTPGEWGGGANSPCFICQVCCCYATHFRVKVKSQEMQLECCDFICQLNQFVCSNTNSERECNFFFFICMFYFMLIFVFEHLVHVQYLFIYALFVFC